MSEKNTIAIVGAAETTQLGEVPSHSTLGLHVDAALNALQDAGIKPGEIDGLACAIEQPRQVAAMLGISPQWFDSTNVGGCSPMVHLRHAAAAIAAGYCKTVLITHGESGRSRIGLHHQKPAPDSLFGQFEAPFGAYLPVTQATLPALRYLKATHTEIEDLARVVVAQRQWALLNPRAFIQEPTTIDDVMNAKTIAYPFTKPMCCLITDGGGALIVTGQDRASEFKTKPVYVLGSGEALESAMVSMMEDYTYAKGFKATAAKAFASAGISHADVDHLMIYDAFAHIPLLGLESLGFCKPGEAKDFYRAGTTLPGGSLPTNTNGGGLCYTHSGMYGIYAILESIRQLRGEAAAQVENATVSLCHGMGNMFSAAATVIMSNTR